MHLQIHCSSFVFIIIWLGQAQCELYTAVDELEELLYAEVAVADKLDSYIQSEEQRLEKLRAFSEDYRTHGSQSLKDIKASVENPVKAFSLIKRLTSDWEKVKELYSSPTSDVHIYTYVAIYFPTGTDLTGAGNTLLRIQDTYELSPAQIANGQIDGVKWTAKLTAGDCFKVGHIAYLQKKYYQALLWFEESLVILGKEKENTTNEYYVKSFLSVCNYRIGNVKEAMRLTLVLLELTPTDSTLNSNMHVYIDNLHNHRSGANVEPNINGFKNNHIFQGDQTQDFLTYAKLCRGEKTHEDYLRHKLTCQFKRHHPFFYIRPLREETVNINPRIAVYHDIMTDNEINTIKQHAQPKLSRSGIYNDDGISEYRRGKTAWLTDDENGRIHALSEKVHAMTNMSVKTADFLQVLNYGIGGHFEPHVDFLEKGMASYLIKRNGNRIMTVLCYMSDVEAGGATVFPKLGVTLWPIKGSCVVWYNLKANGDGDYRTQHADCPVLHGSKWVSTKWIHERGQEFSRPCSLNPYE